MRARVVELTTTGKRGDLAPGAFASAQPFLGLENLNVLRCTGFSANDLIADVSELGLEVSLVADHTDFAGFVSSLDHFMSVGNRSDERLFAADVNSRLEAVQNLRDMLRVRRSDHHRVWLYGRQHLVVIVECRGFCRNRAVLAHQRDLFIARIDQSDDFCFSNLLKVSGSVALEATATDHCDSDFVHR